MSLESAALELFKRIDAPLGMVNVLAWHIAGADALKIWVEPRFLWKVKEQAPNVFEGYQVVVEERPSFTPFLH